MLAPGADPEIDFRGAIIQRNLRILRPGNKLGIFIKREHLRALD